MSSSAYHWLASKDSRMQHTCIFLLHCTTSLVSRVLSGCGKVHSPAGCGAQLRSTEAVRTPGAQHDMPRGQCIRVSHDIHGL